MPQRSTLLNIMASAAYVLEPLYRHYVEFLRSGPVIPTDDTPVMLLLPRDIPPPRDADPKSRRIHQVLSAARKENRTHVLARMWVYRSLGPDGANVFDFTVSRHRDGPQEFLKDFTGTLLGDCYSGLESIALSSNSRPRRKSHSSTSGSSGERGCRPMFSAFSFTRQSTARGTWVRRSPLLEL